MLSEENKALNREIARTQKQQYEFLTPNPILEKKMPIKITKTRFLRCSSSN